MADERDGVAPLRSDDMFYGDKAGDPQPDWVDLTKVAIPQADEQQRLLANLILKMNADKKPLPRFWYFPRGEKAVVLMASDNHGSENVETRFEADVAASPAGCSVANWDCIRSSVYLYTGALPSDAVAKAWENQGFEVGLHVNTGCVDWTPASLDDDFTNQMTDFFNAYPSLLPLATHRTHCIAWSDWASQPKVELQKGIRLDTNYYYWPPGWVNNTPGFFTGSGMPMRFADLDGTLIDVYQATTQMTDESGQTYPFTINTLLDRAIGAEGYYGVFTANIHTDGSTESQAAAIVASAKARSVPVVSAKQMLTWLDGRGASSFTGISWDGSVLSFGVTVGAGANGLQAMLPSTNLASLTRSGTPVTYTTETIKGTSYAIFLVQAGTYLATYGSSLRTLTVTLPANGTITGSGINCGTGGSDCTETYTNGTVVPLTATPDASYTFGGWTGACTGTGACSVTMTANRTVGATFTPPRFTLTVTPPTGGTITATGINCGTGGSDCTQDYDQGTVVPLTATPATGYTFGGWTGACSGTGACSVTMTAARTVGATFTIQRFTLTVTLPTNGTITGTGIDCGTGGSDCTEIVRLRHRRPPHRDAGHRLQPQRLDGSLQRHRRLLRDHDGGEDGWRHLRGRALHPHRHPAHGRGDHRHRHQLRRRRRRLQRDLRLRHRRRAHRDPEHRVRLRRLDRGVHGDRALLRDDDGGADGGGDLHHPALHPHRHPRPRTAPSPPPASAAARAAATAARSTTTGRSSRSPRRPPPATASAAGREPAAAPAPARRP